MTQFPVASAHTQTVPEENQLFSQIKLNWDSLVIFCGFLLNWLILVFSLGNG